MRGATAPQRAARHSRGISIHAPREGSDLAYVAKYITKAQISIHAPREGSDEAALSYVSKYITFLSTLPVRGATASGTDTTSPGRDFYPRSP